MLSLIRVVVTERNHIQRNDTADIFKAFEKKVLRGQTAATPQGSLPKEPIFVDFQALTPFFGQSKRCTIGHFIARVSYAQCRNVPWDIICPADDFSLDCHRAFRGTGVVTEISNGIHAIQAKGTMAHDSQVFLKK
jgi:hypothetical protein